MDGTDEKTLIKRLKAKDGNAFAELMALYKEKAFGTAFGFTGNIEEARDIAQEAFIKVFENIKGFNEDSKFFTWFYRILMNICIDRSRKNKFYKIIPLFQVRKSGKNEEYESEVVPAGKGGKTPEEEAENKELGEKIRRSMEKLSIKEKEVFEMKHYQGLKIKEIAEIMKLREGTIKAFLFRAINKMKEALGDELV